MNLIIDIGNTATKLGLFDKTDLVQEKYVPTELTKSHITDFIGSKHIKNVILSSVTNHQKEIDTYLSQYKYIRLTHKTKLPITIKYATPETIGRDRIAGMVAGYYTYPNENVLVIDMGTCIKYDFTTKEKLYLGGAIAPGMKMRFQSLHTFTDQLPLIENYELDNWIGNSTETSIISGVMNGIIQEIEGVIAQYETKFQTINIIMTGGDHKSFVKAIKKPIFANSFLVMEGLNYILNYNSENS